MRRQPQVVMVTGAGSGIGRATAEAFAERNATVLVTDVDERSAKETAELIERRGGRAKAHRLDVSDPRAWETLAARIVKSDGVPDVLVNNAGIATAGPFLDNDAADWARVLGVNLLGVIHGCRVIGQHMVDKGAGGHIVNVGSMNSFTPASNLTSYAVSKAGVKMLSECLRSELSPHGIGVTVVMPGMINTNIVRATTVVDSVTASEALSAMQSTMERAFSMGWSPGRVARAIVRAVRYDIAILPVGPEAWTGYWMSRLSPAVVRRAGGQALSVAQLERFTRLLPVSLRRAS